MYDSLFVRRLQSISNLHPVVDHFPERQWCPFYNWAKRFTFQQLGHQVWSAFIRSHVIHRENIGMVDGTGRPRFLLEAAQTLRVSRKVQQHFHCHVTIEIQIARSVHLSHSPGANLGDDFVTSKLSAGKEGHGHGRRDYTPRLKCVDVRLPGERGPQGWLRFWEFRSVLCKNLSNRLKPARGFTRKSTAFRPCSLLYVGDFTLHEGNLQIFVHVDLLRSQIHNLLGLTKHALHLVGRLAHLNGRRRCGWLSRRRGLLWRRLPLILGLLLFLPTAITRVHFQGLIDDIRNLP